MAYNLNYNPGIDHERAERRKKMIIVWASIFVVVVIIALVVIGFMTTAKKNDEKAQVNGLSAEQRSQLLNSMKVTSTSTRVYTKGESALIRSMSSNQGSSSSEQSISDKDREQLLKAMSSQ